MTYPQPSSPSSAPLPVQGGSQEPDELTKFRDDWKHEVQLHHRVEETHRSSVDPIPPADGLLSAQHYPAEGIPQAQDSFVSLQHTTSFVVPTVDDVPYRRLSSTYSSGYTSLRTRATRTPSQTALYPRSSRAFPNPSHSNAKKKQNLYT